MHSKANKIKMFGYKKSKYDAINLGIDLIQLSKEWNDLLSLHQYSFFKVFRNSWSRNYPHFSTKLPTGLAKNMPSSMDLVTKAQEALVLLYRFSSMVAFGKIIIGDHKMRFSCSHPHDLATFADLRI